MNEQIYYFRGKKYFGDNLPIRTLLYGEGVFETFRCIDFKLPVYYDMHIGRLQSGCGYFSVPLPEQHEITSFISRSLTESAIDDAYVKLCVLSNGPAYYSALPDSSSLILIIKDYPEVRGKVSVSISGYKRNSEALIINYKSFNYLENIILKRKIQDEGFDEAILLNESNFVTECITHNIFWISDRILFTPSSSCGILPGITRSVLIDTAHSMGLQVNEGHFTINSLLSSCTVFITNSITGIALVSSITGRDLDINYNLYDYIKHKLLTRLKWI